MRTMEGGEGTLSDPHSGGIHLFSFEWDRVSAPLTISIWLLIVTVTKIVFHAFSRVTTFFPDSALLIVLGLVFGGCFHYIYPEEFYLRPEWFFFYLLPPIVLDAGYFLPNSAFFRNLGAILTYAVIGTLWNTFSIGLTLWLCSGIFRAKCSLFDLLQFAALISAVDPVAVICVFDEIHVNQLLYICVFGESLLNDAVTVVLYNAFGSINKAGVEHLNTVDFLTAGMSFFVVAFGGILIGAIWAIITGFTTKHTTHLNVVQPLICLLFPYLAYLLAEMVHMSGILAIMVCGLMMKQYLAGNLSRKSLITVKYFLKTLSSSCEAIIFVFLGVSTVSKQHDFDLSFVLITTVACLVYRCAGVLVLTKILNRGRLVKINYVDQFIMAYGGLRGAVCYGLVMSIVALPGSPKYMFVTATVFVILFTVFVQGVTIKPLVQMLKVKRDEEHKKTVIEQIVTNVQDYTMAGVESIVGYHGQYWFREKFDRLNDLYIKPYLMSTFKNRAATKVLERHEQIAMKEAVCYLRMHGSFAGLPTSQSRNQLNQMVPNSSLPNHMESAMLLAPPGGVSFDANCQKRDGDIPRNESVSNIVRDKLIWPNILPFMQMYSRHLLDSDMEETRGTGTSQDGYYQDFASLDRENYMMTYPYTRGSQKDLLLEMRRRGRPSAAGSSNQGANNGKGGPVSFTIGGAGQRKDSTDRKAEDLPRFVVSTGDDPPPAPRPNGRNHGLASELRLHLPPPSMLNRPGASAAGQAAEASSNDANVEDGLVLRSLSSSSSNERKASLKDPLTGDEKRSLLTIVEMDEVT